MIECKEPFRYIPFDLMLVEGKHLGKILPGRWEEYVVMMQGDYRDAGEYVENTRHHFWYPFSIRVVSTIQDCIRKVYTGPLGKENRSVIRRFVEQNMTKGVIDLNKVTKAVIAYQFPVTVLEGDLPPEEGYVSQRSMVGVAFKNAQGTTEAIDVPLLIDWKLLQLLKVTYADYRKNHAKP